MLDITSTNFASLTPTDAAEIAHLIRALRALHTDSKVQTHKTQSSILRQLTPATMCAVALELDKPTDGFAALRGEKAGR